MNAADLVAMTTVSRDYDWEYNGSIFLPVAGREVALQLLCDIDNVPSVVTQNMADALAELCAVAPDRWPEIAALLLADAQNNCEIADLGFDPVDGETITQTNRREVGLTPDGNAPAGWAQPAWIERVQVCEGDGALYASIGFSIAWETEHGCHIRLENGAFTQFNP